MLTALSLELSTNSTTCFCSGVKRSEITNWLLPPNRSQAPMPRSMYSIISRSRCRLAAVAISFPFRRIAPEDSFRVSRTLQFVVADVTPAMPESFGQYLMIACHRHPLKHVILGIFQRGFG